MAQALTGTFTTATQSAAVVVMYGFNVSLWGTFVGTVQPERSFDAGVTWLPVTYVDGSALQWTAPMSTPLDERENGVVYRLNCLSISSGTVNYRISQ